VLLDGLGKDFEIANVSIKPYSCCKFNHHAIYTALKLQQQHDIKAEHIEKVIIKTFSHALEAVVLNNEGVPKYAPRTINEAQFSMPFTVAMALIKGDVFSDILTRESLKDSKIIELARKIKVEGDPEKDKIMEDAGISPADVEIHMVDGEVYSGCEPFVRGHPRNPMSFGEVVEKFWRCVKLSANNLREDRLNGFIAQVEKLDEIDDVRNLVAYIT
jgi:2-methylcitrate dehydratase PrpD